MSKMKTKIAMRKFDALPDTVDFRDQMYVPTLFEVPLSIPLTSYLAFKVPVLDQGQEGACTGFGLATVANYLLRRRKHSPDNTAVSPRMFYETAKFFLSTCFPPLQEGGELFDAFPSVR